MSKEIDLTAVMLTAVAGAAWHQLAGRVALGIEQLKRMGRDIPPIPDERARVEDNGTLTIYVSIPNVLDVSLSIPADQWVYRQ